MDILFSDTEYKKEKRKRKKNKRGRNYKDMFSTPPFLQPHLWHIEFPRPGVKLELHLRSSPQPWQHQIQAKSAPCAAACSNAGSLTH